MQIEALQVPITADAQGTLRVGGTRVTLDTLVMAFEQGATPEHIAQDYAPLPLTDVYAVLAYYLQHRDEVEAYLQTRHASARHIRDCAGTHVPGLRQRLLERPR